MEKRKREIVLGGYGKQNEQGICFAEFAPEQGSLRKISGIRPFSPHISGHPEKRRRQDPLYI